MRYRLFIGLLTACLGSAVLTAWAMPLPETGTVIHGENAEKRAQRMQWFHDAKLGIFIHWGIYAVDGVDESWAFFNAKLTHDDYMQQLQGFTADQYDPKAWGKLIAESGARYAVLTSRHHDGVALWDSAQGLNVVRDTPARRDLIAPFVAALRERDVKVGLYYSLPDWSYPDYDVFTRVEKRYDLTREPERWQRYLDYYQNQIADLQQRYQPDLIWFDGDWEHDAQTWQSAQLRRTMLARNPALVINSRLNGYGDYATPELGLPVVKPWQEYWELCLTMNRSWGYQPRDEEYKSPHQIIQILAQTISLGGNLLLDIGPRADGTIDPRQIEILQRLGRWTGKHAEAIYATRAGIGLEHFAGPSTLSADAKTVYLFVDGKPNGDILVKGLDSTVQRAWVVGGNQPVSARVLGKYDWARPPGLLFLSVPADALDPDITVIGLELADPVQLYREESRPIESNG